MRPLAVLATLSICLSAQAADPLVFSAMGCGPYSSKDAEAMRFFIAKENEVENRSQFLIHLGDICTGAAARKGEVTEKAYSKIKDAFTRGNTIPSYIVPGDNEWNDRPDPDRGWVLWNKHLLGLEKNFRPKWTTERQEVRQENFAFVSNGVLVIGLNLPGGRVHDHDEWARRFRENNDWVEAQFEKHKTDARAAVVCAQANVLGMGKVKVAINALFLPFRKRFGELAADFGKPVLFLHADGHKWLLDQPWKAAPNITRVQVDRIESKFPPVQITVDPDGKEVFSFERRLKDQEWKP